MQNQEYPNFPTETTNHMNESQDSYLSNVAIIINWLKNFPRQDKCLVWKQDKCLEPYVESIP